MCEHAGQSAASVKKAVQLGAGSSDIATPWRPSGVWHVINFQSSSAEQKRQVEIAVGVYQHAWRPLRFLL